MGKDSPEAPPAPDYQAAAREQGEQNIKAARTQANLSRYDIATPYGTQEWQDLGGDRWGLSQQLAPEQQQLYDTATGARQQGIEGLSQRAGQDLDLTGLPQFQTSVQQSDLSGLPDVQTGVGPQTLDFNNVAPDAQARLEEGYTTPGIAQDQLDFSGLGQLPNAQQYGDQRQEVVDAMYGMHSRQLDPRFEQQSESIRTGLRNQGVTPGSEAWNRAMDQFGRERTGAYGEARERAILAGGQEQSRLLSDALKARQQGVSEITTGGQFAQQAAAQERDAEAQALQLANQMRQRGASEEQARAAFEASQQQARFGQESSLRDQLGQEEELLYNQRLQDAQLQNQARQQMVNELVTQRQLPMQELSTLYQAGGQYTPPQFGGGTAPTANIQPVDTLGATEAEYQAQLDAYNADQAGQNAKKGSTTGLVGMGLNAFAPGGGNMASMFG